MILNRLCALYLFVDDVKKSSSWYSKVLNIPLKINENHFGLIEIGDNQLCFHREDLKSPVSTGGCVGYWRVNDLRETANLFVKHGGVIYRGPIEIPENNEGICQIKDPFGNVIGLQGEYRK